MFPRWSTLLRLLFVVVGAGLLALGVGSSQLAQPPLGASVAAASPLDARDDDPPGPSEGLSSETDDDDDDDDGLGADVTLHQLAVHRAATGATRGDGPGSLASIDLPRPPAPPPRA